jgi:hypothetical protein
VTRPCRRCGEPFESDRPHHRLCWRCFWELRDAGHFAGADGKSERPANAAPALTLDPRLLRAAVSLTHPDRHPAERAEMATAVTAGLLDLLKTARETNR